MNLERLGEMTREERIKLYNRPDSTHAKIVPMGHGEQPPGAWGEAYRRIVQGREKAKKRETGK